MEQKACPGPFGDHLEKEAEKAENIAKHGISFIKAAETFTDPLGIVLEDTKHSTIEDRFYWVGRDSKGEILTTRYTIRELRIRIFGCAKWREFKEKYYEAAKNKKS